MNTVERVLAICRAIKKTYKYYENLFVESDQVRLLKLYEAKYRQQLDKLDEEESDHSEDSGNTPSVKTAQA